jgi:hypothetical protein
MLAPRRSLRRCSGVVLLSKTPKPVLALTRKRVRELEKIFAHFGLNADSPEDWPRLREQVTPHLGQHNKRGRRKGSRKWTDHRLLNLAADLFELSKQGATAQEAAAMLKKKPHYADCAGSVSIYKRMRSAKRVWQLSLFKLNMVILMLDQTARSLVAANREEWGCLLARMQDERARLLELSDKVQEIAPDLKAWTDNEATLHYMAYIAAHPPTAQDLELLAAELLPIC